jgi:RNA polymerase sigma-70 factor (ECF subfamily)
MQDQAAFSGRVKAVDPYESRLVERAREGSPDAWDEIYSRHQAPIYRYIHARVFDDATAQDITSSVFLAAVKSIRSYRYRGQPLLAWFYRIARNLVSSHQRTLLRRRTVLFASFRGTPDGTSEVPAGDHAPDPASSVENMDLRAAIAKLPQAQREALLLKFYAGLDAKEIAAVMDKDPAAVYSLQARALDGLRRILA